MEKENSNDFLRSLEEDLEKDLRNLNIDNKKNQAEFQTEITELVKKQLTEAEKKTEEKLRKFYYWLFGVVLVLLVIIVGVFLFLWKGK